MGAAVRDEIEAKHIGLQFQFGSQHERRRTGRTFELSLKFGASNNTLTHANIVATKINNHSSCSSCSADVLAAFQSLFFLSNRRHMRVSEKDRKKLDLPRRSHGNLPRSSAPTARRRIERVLHEVRSDPTEPASSHFP